MLNLVVFVIYLLLLVGIGYITYLRTNTLSDYTLAGRSNNKWITAISAESSDMSGWLLLGLPGMAFLSGFAAIWTVIGILFGTLFNWTVIANRLRTASEYYNALTIPEYINKRFNDKKGILGLIAGIVIVIFMIINSSAEIIGSGKLLNAAFGVDYNVGIIIGMIIVLIYTFLGGFLAVSWSNLLQGSMMFIALIIVPIAALLDIGGLTNLNNNLIAQDTNLFSFWGGGNNFWAIFALIMGGIGIGIGYPGQPHILANFMSIKNPKEIKDSTLIAMVWVGLTTYGAVIVGLVGRGLYKTLEDPEQVFLVMIRDLFPNYMIGLFAAAVMAAILSSVSAYLLVAAASFSINVYKRFIKIGNENKSILIERITLIVVAVLAYALSQSGGLVFKVALYAWGGLAASFGPLIIFSLYWEKVNRAGAMASMIVGMLTILIWYNSGLSQWIYELVPGFAFSIIALILVSYISGGPDKETIESFTKYLESIRGTDYAES